MAHDGSSYMLDLRLGIRRPRQRCAADQRWPVLRPVLHKARHSRKGATDTRERHQSGGQRRGAAVKPLFDGRGGPMTVDVDHIDADAAYSIAARDVFWLAVLRAN